MSKRVKISFAKFREIRLQIPFAARQLYFLKEFQTESGLVVTSVRRDSKHPEDYFNYYFKVIDKEKYFLSKIKYGF